MHFNLWITLLLFLIVLSNVSTDAKEFKVENLPNDEFVLTKSRLEADEDFLKKVSKEMGKVSDEVRYFVEKLLRVGKTLLRDWILKNEDGSDAREETRN